MSKFLMRKLNVDELLRAAKGEFEIDLSSDLAQALSMDDEARTLGLLTKSASVGDSRMESMMSDMKSGIDAILAALKASTETLAQAAAPIQPQGDVTKVIADLRAEIANLKSEIVATSDKAAQATATIEAIRADMLASRAGAASSNGKPTPEMLATIAAVQAGSIKSSDDFPFDSAVEG